MDSNGVLREPSCSGAPRPPLFTEPYPTEFSFFVRPGDPSRLVMGLDGGGACWDPLTCLGSVLDNNPIYDPEIDETPASLDATGGLSDQANPANPVAGHLQVFIPYCTGDLHMGSRDQVYSLPLLGARTIRHCGYDNVVAVPEWIRRYYASYVGTPPRQVFVAGASAGGYGAFFAYPAIDRMLPCWTRKRAFSDSAIGIINQDFYDRALAPGGVWGVWDNMPAEFAGAFASGPEVLPVVLNRSLGWHFPRSRFGQYTRAFDTPRHPGARPLRGASARAAVAEGGFPGVPGARAWRTGTTRPPLCGWSWPWGQARPVEPPATVEAGGRFSRHGCRPTPRVPQHTRRAMFFRVAPGLR